MYIIIGGGGDVGYYLTRNLLTQGHEVLLLEKESRRYQILSEELGQSVFRGDACEAATMEEAGARRAIGRGVDTSHRRCRSSARSRVISSS